jgi:hypothetical protein
MNFVPTTNSNLYLFLKFGIIVLILLLWLTMFPAPVV